MNISGVIVQYNKATGMGIIKDSDCEEHVFNYSGQLAPELTRGTFVCIERDDEFNDVVYLAQ